MTEVPSPAALAGAAPAAVSFNEAFRFSNPNTKGECGCGESFSV